MQAVEIVSLHKQATGQRYKSDYAAILKWGIDAAAKKSGTHMNQISTKEIKLMEGL
jgi:hypothetical protein